MAKTDFFRIAVEGETATDGRVITREMILESVGNFSKDTPVRINCEHIRGFSPEPPFNAYGDVLGLKAENYSVTLDGKQVDRLALYAQIDPTAQLIKLNRDKQKVYTSCEFQPNFAGTAKYGLAGLAVTDSPASLGVERLKFSALKDGDHAAVAAEIRADLDRRKLNPANLFSAALETGFKLVEEDDQPGAVDKFVAILTEKLGLSREKPAEDPKTPEPKTPETAAAFSASDFGAAMTAFAAATAADRKADQTAFSGRLDGIEKSIGDLKATIETTPSKTFSQRPPVTGGDGRVLADC